MGCTDVSFELWPGEVLAIARSGLSARGQLNAAGDRAQLTDIWAVLTNIVFLWAYLHVVAASLVTGPIEEFETFLSEESPAIHGDRVASTGRAASCRSAIEVARYACVPHLQGRN